MLTKEEVIILRTIFLEFGDQELREKRLLFPYENIAEGLGGINDKQCKANLGPLINGLKSFERAEIDDIVFNFYLMGGQTIENLPATDNLVIVEGKHRITGWEDDEGVQTRDECIFLKKHSKSSFFTNLRMGLYYKGLGKYAEAIGHFEAARQEYQKVFSRVVEQATGNLMGFLDRFYDLEKKAFKDTFIAGKDYLSQVKIPSELLCAIEETPDFHLGEMYLDQGENFIHDGKNSEAESLFRKANQYFEESQRAFCTIFYGKDSSNYEMDMLRELNILSLPSKVFSRNYYLEKNLELVKSKGNMSEDQIPIEALKNEQQVSILKRFKELVTVVKSSIQQECQMRYRGWEKLSQKTQNFLVEALWQEKIDSVDAWGHCIMDLSLALENELTEKLLPFIPSKYRYEKYQTTKNKMLNIEEFKYIIDNAGKELFNMPSSEIGELSKKLKRLSNIRGEKGAHPIKAPSFEDVKQYKEILLGANYATTAPIFDYVLNLWKEFEEKRN